ncbi:MAG: hypothetical protein CBC38_00480 [Gammaproteobacteria bacterium TMED78]|nr:MAG: hypothetical protein CBC38_00480 [Gammaproteobacteria bacterium TMED78]|tara:strand:+ start:40473 stop:43160 length:2688 start_codon:yes stop_codon:yes gene_type:complete
MKNDTPERQNALDVKKSYIVQAPAGSGKTELLIQRYLALLLEVSEPEQVLAITFTKKASLEMKERVIDSINTAKQLEIPKEEFKVNTYNLARKVIDRSIKKSWNIELQPYRLKIITIDAVSSSIVNDMPVLSGGISKYKIVDNAEKFYSLAIKRLLERMDNNPDLHDAYKNVFYHLDGNYNYFKSLLLDMLLKRDQWLPYLMTESFFNKNSIEVALSGVIEHYLLEVTKNIPSRLMNILLEIIPLIPDNDSTEYSNSSWRELKKIPPPKAKYLNDWKIVSCLLITNTGTWRKNIPSKFSINNDYKKVLINEIYNLESNSYLLSLLYKIKKLPVYSYDENQSNMFKSLRLLLINLVANLKVVFNEQRVTDFIEINLSASEALGSIDRPSDLLLALDYSIKHILIDEFHDTSFTQFKLLQALTSGWQRNDGRTIFLVGDPMQSIYGFRDADISLFEEVINNGIGDIEIQPLFLCNNYRSSEQIVEWINLRFKKLFSPNSDLLSDFIKFRPSVSKKISNNDSFIKYVNFNSSSEFKEVSKVVDIIKSELERDANQTIGILVRSRNHLFGLQEKLNSNGVHCNAIEINSFKDSDLIQNLIGLTRGLLHLGDRAAWISILRAPWCGITWPDLVNLLQDKETMTISEIINSDHAFKNISIDGNYRLKKLKKILNQSNKYRSKLTLSEWIKKIWLKLDGPELFFSEEEHLAESFFNILHSVEDNGDLEDPIALGNYFNSYVPSNNNVDSNINIMTIHKSKGLEFDTVILFGLGRAPVNEKSKLLEWLDFTKNNKKEYIFSPISPINSEPYPLSQFIKYINNKKRDLEKKRLFYVATSRAKSRLYLLSNLNPIYKKPFTGTFLSFYWDDVKDQFKKTTDVDNAIKSNNGLVKIPLRRYIIDKE